LNFEALFNELNEVLKHAIIFVSDIRVV